MKIIFDTNNYYEGFNVKEDSWILGSYSELSSDSDVDTESIRWSNFAYDEEKMYFMEFLEILIKNYEKRYRTSVDYLGLVGRVGLWNGNPVGGRIIKSTNNPIEFMGNVDIIDVVLDDNGLITIRGYHHDGIHLMNLYLLTENKLKKVAPDFLRYGEYGHLEMEKIHKELRPLKAGKTGVGYYGSYAS